MAEFQASLFNSFRFNTLQHDIIRVKVEFVPQDNSSILVLLLVILAQNINPKSYIGRKIGQRIKFVRTKSFGVSSDESLKP